MSSNFVILDSVYCILLEYSFPHQLIAAYWSLKHSALSAAVNLQIFKKLLGIIWKSALAELVLEIPTLYPAWVALHSCNFFLFHLVFPGSNFFLFHNYNFSASHQRSAYHSLLYNDCVQNPSLSKA